MVSRFCCSRIKNKIYRFYKVFFKAIAILKKLYYNTFKAKPSVVFCTVCRKNGLYTMSAKEKTMLKAICSKKDLTLCSYYNCISDIIDSEELEKLKQIKHHIATTRFQHCVNVSYYSYVLCRKFRLNARAAARAGLLHDLFFYDRKEYNSSREKGQPGHSSMHSQIAVQNASELTDISDLERDIIEKHMWPVTRPKPLYKETYVITVIDKYCAVLEFCVPKVTKAAERITSRNKQ